MARRHRVPFLDLHGVFRHDYLEHGQKFNSTVDYHWNERGYAVAAKAIKQLLVSRGPFQHYSWGRNARTGHCRVLTVPEGRHAKNGCSVNPGLCPVYAPSLTQQLCTAPTPPDAAATISPRAERPA